LSQPSCTLRLGRVRSFEASKTGAACNSVWAKISETKIGLRASDLGPRSAVRGLKSEQNHFSKAMLVRVSDYGTYACEGGDLFRSTLRVATGDYDLGFGILSMNAADSGTSVPVSSGGYGAGVEDNDSGLGGLAGSFQASLLKLTLDGSAVRLGSAAAEIYYVESCHALF
jgi:hypothetical protein